MALPLRAARRRVEATSGDLFRFERALTRTGFSAVAGIDEAGRGACAGPLVVAAAVIGPQRKGNPYEGLADSKLLTAATRERMYEVVIKHALVWSVVVIPPGDVDRLGLHVANIQGMRTALARLSVSPDYVLSDGFAVPGVGRPNLGVWKGDQVCACVAAAGILAKVTRDRIMVDLHEQWPMYGFDEHKGYVTSGHRQRLATYGPSPHHRYCFAPVRRAAAASPGYPGRVVSDDGRRSEPDDQPRKGAA